MAKDVAKNASGDLFEIWRRDGKWHAEQVTGCAKNWLSIAAHLQASSRTALLQSLGSHFSNA